jgi:hypothetical protein
VRNSGLVVAMGLLILHVAQTGLRLEHHAE